MSKKRFELFIAKSVFTLKKCQNFFEKKKEN